MALFSHVNANTGRIHIHVALTGKSERENERGRGRRERRVGISFFPPLFLHLSLNKNTLNPF